MGFGHRIGTLALVLASGGAGWLLHGWTLPPQPGPAAAVAPPARPAAQDTAGSSLLAFPQAAAPAEGEDVVELHPDGSASVRVQHRPPAWVLAELCRQGAQGLAGCRAAPAQALAAPAAGTLNASTAPTGYQTPMQARAQGQPLPDATLKSLMQSDPVEDVRMEAFEDYVEAHSGTEAEIRAALQEVLRIPNPVLQARARAQLDEMDEAARLDAAAGQPPRDGAY